jgi:membrane dipeptidase
MIVHPRNKADELITLLALEGRFVGLSRFGPHMKKENDSTIDDYIEPLEYVIGLAEGNLVGIGSDSSEGHGRPSEYMAWCNKDKDNASQFASRGSQKVVKPLGKLEDNARLACRWRGEAGVKKG